MPHREVEASFTIEVDANSPQEARGDAAARTAIALRGIEGKQDGHAIGTSGGEEVED